MKEQSKAKILARRASRELVADIYKATRHFDRLQQYKYGNEIRKLATSMSSYITEGSSRHEFEDQNTYLLLGYETMVDLLKKLVEVQKLNILSAKHFIVLKVKIDDLAQKIDLITKTENNENE